VVCFDESPVQLIGEVRQPIPPNRPARTLRLRVPPQRHVNLFVCVDVHRPWRKVKVTERRAAEDYAHCMRELVDVHYPDAACIRVVQDNLSTHSAGSLYEAFAPAEARRILRRLEFHYTPKPRQLAQHGRDRDRRAAASASTAESTTQTAPPRIDAWDDNETPPAPASNGCSQPQSPRQNGPRLSRHIQRVIITVTRY